MVEGGGHLPTGLLLAALEAVSRGLGAARQQVEAAQSQLAAVRQAAWSQAVLAAADACMFSEAWHAAWHADAAGGPAGYRRSVELARDMLKHDLLPLLCAASAQQDGATGFCLGEQYRALLAMGGWVGARRRAGRPYTAAASCCCASAAPAAMAPAGCSTWPCRHLGDSSPTAHCLTPAPPPPLQAARRRR